MGAVIVPEVPTDQLGRHGNAHVRVPATFDLDDDRNARKHSDVAGSRHCVDVDVRLFTVYTRQTPSDLDLTVYDDPALLKIITKVA